MRASTLAATRGSQCSFIHFGVALSASVIGTLLSPVGRSCYGIPARRFQRIAPNVVSCAPMARAKLTNAAELTKA